MMDGEKKITSHEIAAKYAKYPYFILVPYKRAADLKSEYRNQIGFLLGAFESTLKYMAILLVSFYRQDDGLENKEVNKLIEKLREPALGQYSGLLRKLIDSYRNVTQVSFIREMVDLYSQEVPEFCLQKMKYLANSIGKSFPSNCNRYKDLLDILVDTRNALAHGAGGVDEREIGPFTEAFWTLMETLLERIKPIAENEILEMKGRHSTIEKGNAIEIRTWNGFSPSIEILPESNAGQLKHVFQLGHLYAKSYTVDMEEIFMDLSPLIMSLDCKSCNLPQIFFMNGASKKQYDFLSYQCAHQVYLDISHPLFQNIKENLKDSKIGEKDGGSGVPSWVNIRTPTAESQALYMKAQSLKTDGDVNSAIKNLQFSINLTPGYKEAVELLFSIFMKIQDIEKARSTLANYLTLIPDDVNLLKKAYNLEIEAGDLDAAKVWLTKIIDIDAKDSRALELRNHLKRLAEDPQGMNRFSAGDPQAPGELGFQIEEIDKMENYAIERPMLAYEYFVTLMKKGSSKIRIRATKLILGLWIGIMTTATALYFYMQKDTMMALTVISLGILWAFVVKATYKIRKIIFNSQHNILAFVKGYDNNTLYSDLITPIFGNYFDENNDPISLKSGLKKNGKRFLFLLAGGLVGILWALKLTQYSIYNNYLVILYSSFMFFLYGSLVYLISCVVMYQKLLKNLRFQNIHFSLVQHPKLSIRYLSYLSRRISYPLLGVYILFVFAVYLGPFLSNLVFVLFFSILIFFIISMYANTILLIRHIIQKNKWKLISEFSVHFDVPFKRLIDKAKMEDMKRLLELIDIRKFIESIDEWAEKKIVLLVTSLFYLSMIVFATFGLGNLMTRIIVPKITKIATVQYNRTSHMVLTPSLSDNHVQIDVRNVDDSVIAGWAETEDELVQESRAIKYGKDYLNSGVDPRSSRSGYYRCDWQNGKHGAMNLRIPFNGSELHVLVMAYNKEYHSPIGLGGGKLSYDIQIRLDGQEIEKDRRFLRVNNRDIGYVTYVHLKKAKGRIDATVYIGGNMLPTSMRECTTSMAKGLSEESDATVTF